MTVDCLDIISPDDTHQLKKRPDIVIEHERGTGNINMVQPHSLFPQLIFIEQVVLLVHISGIMYVVSHFL